jgi:dihydrofolate reductase
MQISCIPPLWAVPPVGPQERGWRDCDWERQHGPECLAAGHPGDLPVPAFAKLEHDAAVMGRSTFLPALGAPRWPWPNLQVYVLTSSPLPAGTPSDVIVSAGGPAELARRLRSRGSDKDVHLVGGPRTIRAFQQIGELDRLEIVVLPILLGDGIPLSPPGAGSVPLRLLRADRTFPDGSAELVYTTRG